MPLRLPINTFGGINENDQEEELIARAYTASQTGYSQRAPFEMADATNCDYTKTGIRKRKGSTEYKDFTATGLNILVASDSLIAGVEWVDPATGSAIEVVVSTKTIYTNQSGTFAQINNAAGSAYTHTADVTKVSFAAIDGHLFIGLDGTGNYIQVYRSGAALDDILYNTDNYMDVDADSASGAAILYVSNTSIFNVGDRISIDLNNPNEEFGYITSISAGASLTLASNLSNTHSAISFTEKSNPKNFGLRGLCFGDSLYVAVGAADGTDAYIATSPDGTTWTERSNPKNVALYRVKYGADIYVAVGLTDGSDGYIITSPDGVTWTERSNPQNCSLFGLDFGNNLFIACGNPAGGDLYIVTSPDGVTWTERATSLTSAYLYAMKYGNGIWMTGGGDSSNRAILMISNDNGVTWTSKNVPKHTSEPITAIAYGNGVWVCVGWSNGSDAYIISSDDDGTTWTERSNPKDFDLNDVIFENNIFTAVGDADGTDAYVLVSIDGKNWYERDNDKNFTLLGITYGNGIYIVAGSPDGTDAYMGTYDVPILVRLANRYTEAYDTSTTHTITGEWDDATYLLAEFQTRLLSSTGNTLVSYSPEAYTTASGIWDAAGDTAGFFQAAGNLRSLSAFAPYYSNQINEALYVGTDVGFEVKSGFTASDALIRLPGAKSPINHNCVAKALNWLVYLTDDKNILAINGSNVIDVGRRLKSYAGTGKLDQLSVTDSRTIAYGFYSKDKKQAYFAFASGASGTNDKIAVIDFALGEPVLGESQASFEQHVRCLYWNYGNATPTFYRNVYQKSGAVIGILGTGFLYSLESGNTDLGSENIDTDLELPEIIGGNAQSLKQWFRLHGNMEGQTSGTPTLSLAFKVNRKSTNFKTDTWSLLVTAASQVTTHTKINTRSESLKMNITSTDSYEWIIHNLSLVFDIGAEILQ